MKFIATIINALAVKRQAEGFATRQILEFVGKMRIQLWMCYECRVYTAAFSLFLSQSSLWMCYECRV